MGRFDDVDLSFLQFISFIAVIAAMVQLVEMFIDKYQQTYIRHWVSFFR